MLDVAGPKPTGKSWRVLDFDIETRPLSFLGSDRTTDEVTAIACAWIKNGKVSAPRVWLLGIHSPYEMLSGFIERYDEADIVTGHYIRGFDLPTLNGACMDLGMPVLSDKMSHDTKNDLRKARAISKSQENLGAMLWAQLSAEERRAYVRLNNKVAMNTAKWRNSNRLTVDGIEDTRKRVVGDVRQHAMLRKRLIELDYLDKPRVWKSSGAGTGAYTP